ncbi:hypothetical protein [Brevundimonas sp. GCM10030266]|uniref:hypothetical protein n=1 Tax=Brevundimonas sp. GCM10030266 TaxID=3273386 RepID=UPI003620DF5F
MADALSLKTDPAFQERFWRVQRVAWVVFALFVVAALAGLTGAGGPLSRAEVRTPEGLVDSPRVGRWSAADEMRFELSGQNGLARVDLSDRFAAHFQVHDIQPAPDRTEATDDGQALIFIAPDSARSTVVLHVTAENPGLARFDVRLNGGAPVAVTSVILP